MLQNIFLHCGKILNGNLMFDKQQLKGWTKIVSKQKFKSIIYVRTAFMSSLKGTSYRRNGNIHVTISSGHPGRTLEIKFPRLTPNLCIWLLYSAARYVSHSWIGLHTSNPHIGIISTPCIYNCISLILANIISSALSEHLCGHAIRRDQNVYSAASMFHRTTVEAYTH